MKYKAKIIKGKKPQANDVNVPEDEMVLAELIQNAAARGLVSNQGGLFGRFIVEGTDDEYYADGGIVNIDPKCKTALQDNEGFGARGVLTNPPGDADCACALGAQLLTPKISVPLRVNATYEANDASDGQVVTFMSELDLYENPDDAPHKVVKMSWADERSMQIGLAYEQALRP